MRDRAGRVVTFALAASLGLHAAIVLGMTGVAFLKMEPPIPIEVLPLKKTPPAPPAPPKKNPQQPRSRADKPTVKTPAVATNPRVRQPLPPSVEDLHAVGPASANITLVLRSSLLAKSPHREGVETLLSLLPDYHTLLDGTTLKLFDDLDALLIATPDPRDVSATFLAARYHGDPRVRALAERTLSNGDPRQFRALGDDLMVLGRPEELAKIVAAEAGDADEEGKHWLASLEAFDAGPKEAALQLTIADVTALVRLGPGWPMPHRLQLAMSADASPATRLVLVFESAEDAERFVAMWPELKARVASSIPFVAGALDDLVPKRTDAQVELVGTLREAQVRFVLSLAKLLAPPPEPSVTPPPE